MVFPPTTIFVSIHAPAKGATLSSPIMPSKICRFQSTLPRRERPKFSIPCAASDAVSIHAPAKGATIKHLIRNKIKMFQSTLPRRERLHNMSAITAARSFNPRSREGSDISPDILLRAFTVSFNPRSREGSDGVACSICHACRSFNPRSREGSDPVAYALFLINVVSIHAPAKGATPTTNAFVARHGVSIHAPAKGATMRMQSLTKNAEFQSTLPRRERLSRGSVTAHTHCFNPRSREGSDGTL